ncbi:HCP-like protein [Gigaspora margarita]|uniref:HCP-like protein n=1 Tax=Gigaspora margarita TaxID=4874 RepID=A0A8H4AL31_GIGMA|nr:HCP-like protein [Gigaspora margarita]
MFKGGSEFINTNEITEKLLEKILEIEIPDFPDDLTSDNINLDEPVYTINSNFDINSPTDVNESKTLGNNKSFRRIRYFDPIVTIGQTLNDFISVRSVIFEKPSTIEYSKVEKLFLKLETQKDALNHVLNSQNVYAISPYLQEDYSVPCIACWTTEPLKASVMEEISALFNDEFEVMYHLVKDVDINDYCEDNDDETNESSDGNHNVNSGPGGNIPNGISSSKVTGSSNERGENEESPGEGGGGDDGGDGGSNYDNNIDPKLEISSQCSVECEDKTQTFNITVDLWAKIEPPSKYKNEKTLEFKVDLRNCGVTKFLSKQCSSLRGFVCYYLDSFEISFSPISQSLNNTSSIIRSIDFFPNKHNNSINHSKGRDKEHHLQIEAGYPANVKGTYSYGMKKSRSATISLNEWDVDIDYCETNVLINQYPKLVHKLEISFNDIENFNDNFKELEKTLHIGKCLTLENNKHHWLENNTLFDREFSS